MVKKSARRTRRTHSPAFKARVALAALLEDKTMAELRQDFELHASHVIGLGAHGARHLRQRHRRDRGQRGDGHPRALSFA